MRLAPIIAAIAALAMAPAAMAASVTGGASATILRPISITVTQPLALGTLIRPTSGPGIVTLGTDGSLTLGSNVGSVGSHAAGVFSIDGERNTQVVVAVDPTVTLTNTTGGGGETIVANVLNDLPAGNSPMLNNSGNTVVRVGATFTLGTAAVSGAYTGALTVTANYQ